MVFDYQVFESLLIWMSVLIFIFIFFHQAKTNILLQFMLIKSDVYIHLSQGLKLSVNALKLTCIKLNSTSA